jgi:hypothetical protein
LNLA